MTVSEANRSHFSNSGTPDPSLVKIRHFPYPYRAALAISNDLDAISSFAELKAIHDVLNGSKITPCGAGLGLEVGDSFHFYTVHPEQDDTLSYFKGTSSQISDYAPALREGIASGLLDTLHTWGNFSQKGGFFRKYAQRALEELERYNLKIPVWTNHGDIHNFQNLGRQDSLGDVEEKSSARGDRSKVLEYHLDLTLKAGVRYVWVKELTFIVGQERPLDSKDWLQDGTSLGRNILKGFYDRYRNARAEKPIQLSNRLIQLCTFRDGSKAYEILRFGSFHLDGSDDIPRLLDLKNLNRLIEVGGALLLYTHLGKGRPSPEKPFTDETYKAFSRLTERWRNGEVWVTTPARLCQYIELRQRLKLRAGIKNGNYIVKGDFKPSGSLEPPDVSGLTFFLTGAPTCTLELGGVEYHVHQNPADHTGKTSYSVPLKRWEYPWE